MRLGLVGELEICSCYEADYDGFWLHRALEAWSVRNTVLDSAKRIIGMLRGITTDRCHIVARVWGGQDELANLHLLCVLCHEIRENLDGLRYWRWLKAQNTIRAECWGDARMLWLNNFDFENIELKIEDVWDLSIAYMKKVAQRSLGRPKSCPDDSIRGNATTDAGMQRPQIYSKAGQRTPS